MTKAKTISVPLDVAQATVEAISGLPTGQYADLFVAWRNIVQQFNLQEKAAANVADELVKDEEQEEE